MTTITLELPEQLAEQIRRYQADLSHIFELGLQRLKEEKPRTATAAVSGRERMIQERERIDQALLASGLIALPLPDPHKKKRRRHPPIHIGGKPLSEIIIEQRGPL